MKITIALIFTYAKGQDSSLYPVTRISDSLTRFHVIPDSAFIKPDSISIQIEKPTKPEIQIHLPARPTQWLNSTGELSWENHYATLQNPMARSALAYSRLRFQGTLFLAGLPFKTTAFFTTENNSIYQSNFINVRFDAEAHKRMLRQDAEKNLGKMSKSLSYHTLLLEQAKNQLGLLDTQITRLNRSMPKDMPLAIDTNGIGNKILGYGDSLPDKHRNPQFNDTFSNKGRDTLTARMIELKAKQDSLQSLRDSVFKKIGQWQQRYQEDSAKYVEYKALLDGGAQKLLRDSVSSRQQSRLKQLTWLSRIKNFQVGHAIANYNELSLWGTSLIGIDAAMDHSGWVTGITLGRALNADGFFNPGSRPEYTKNLAGVHLAKTDSAQNKIGLSYFYSTDIKKVEQGEENSVLSLDIKKTYKRYALSVLAASSQYQKDNPIWTGAAEKPSVNSFSNKALKSELAIKLDYNARIKGKWNYIGSTFTTIGNPFLRKNYTEAEIAWEQGWLKNKLKSRVFYKDLTTLTDEMNTEQNRVKGAGVSVQSNFSKGLNFFASYSPYEQGNNHPDTAFRTFNRTSLITGGLSYMKTWKKVMWFTQGVFTHSAISGDQLPSTNSELYSLENTVSWNGRHDLRVDISYNRTRPNLDSLNFMSAGGQYQVQVNQKLKIGGGLRSISYSRDSGLTGASLNAQWVFWKTMAVNSSFRLDRVTNLWGVEGTKLVVSSNLILKYSW